MAKGNQQGNVQGNWQQGQPSGMLGPNAQAGGAPQPTQQQSQSGGYAYPWMQAGKWGDIGGTGMSGLSSFLSQYGQQATGTGTPSPVGAPAAATPSTPSAMNTSAPGANSYANAPQGGAGAMYDPADYADQIQSGVRGAPAPRPATQGPWTYNGTPFTYDDGVSKGLWTVPGTLDANGWPTLPDRSTWPDPPEGEWGIPLPAEFQYLDPRNKSILTQQQIDAKLNVPRASSPRAAISGITDPAARTAALNDYYVGNYLSDLQSKTAGSNNPMGLTVTQERINLLKSQGLLPANWGT